MNIIVDTDIGSDVDDIIALLYASQHLPIKCITTVHGCAAKRAQIAEKVVHAIGKEIPIYAGSDKPFFSEEIYLYGHEGHGILDGTEPLVKKGGISFLEHVVTSEDVIIGIGPLTNIALLRPRQFYIMGSIIEQEKLYLPDFKAHNFKVDSDATTFLFSSEQPITVLTTEVAKMVWLTRKEFIALPQKKVFDYVRQNAYDYLAARKQEVAYMYDPLTVMLLTHPEYFTTQTKKNITITTSVDAAKAKQELLETLWKLSL